MEGTIETKEEVRGACFGVSRAGRTANTYPAGCRSFVGKHTRQLLKSLWVSAPEKRPTRRTEAASEQARSDLWPTLGPSFTLLSVGRRWTTSTGGNGPSASVTGTPSGSRSRVWSIRAGRENLKKKKKQQWCRYRPIWFVCVTPQSSTNAVHHQPRCCCASLPFNSSDGGWSAHSLTIFNKTTSSWQRW